MARLNFIVLVALQIVLVKSYPFQDVSDVANRAVESSELNAMEGDIANLVTDVNQQNDDMAEQNVDDLMNEVPNNDNSDQAEESYDSLSQQNADREGGEYKEEENLRNSHVIEGDIYKDKTTTKILEMLENASGREAVTNAVRKWPNGRVPYMFGRVSSQVRSAFRQAIAEYNKYTCIRVVPRRSERDYLYIVSEGGCWSSISKSGGRQKLSLGRGCEYKGIAIHELMHALGFFHEQSRRDRDSYITINWGNIIPGRENNFKMYSHGQADTLNEPYDYSSIMHYPRRAFTRNGRDTIIPKRSGVQIGQRKSFSRIDIKQVNKLYQCSGVVVPTRRPTSGPCVDRSSGCRRWAEKKYCVSGRFISYMRKYCKKTCGVCTGTVTPKCYDTKSSCPRWARAGFCKSKYTVYMNRNCRKSCKKC